MRIIEIQKNDYDSSISEDEIIYSPDTENEYNLSEITCSIDDMIKLNPIPQPQMGQDY